MNKTERLIYNAVKNNVALKVFIKKIYQSIFLLAKPAKVETNYQWNHAEGYFFGFHDKSPWNKSNSKILAHQVNIRVTDLPKADDEARIGYFTDEKLTEFVEIGNTRAWNWQQGSMLQWLGGEDKIIYNAWDEKELQHISRVVDLAGNTLNTFQYPIGAVSPDGKYAASYDFERLNIGMFGYGYPNESADVSSKDSQIPEELGFSIYDMAANKEIVFRSVKEINALLGKRKFDSGYLFVTHFQFSPDNRRFFFLLRAYTKGKRLQSRLISCGLDGENWHVFPSGNMVSHLTWIESDEILAYCTDLHENEGYYLFNDFSSSYKQVGGQVYSSDGHPQYCLRNSQFVTDTYADRKRQQELSIYDLNSKRKTLIGKFYTPMKFSEEFRCDLHPRWDRQGEKICIDTSFSGKRGMAIISLK